MAGIVYSEMALIDTSAVIALFEPNDQFHQEAKNFFSSLKSQMSWCAINITSHETYTRVRYISGWDLAHKCYDFLRSNGIKLLEFNNKDEYKSKELLLKYKDQKLSFHDALCATIMLRNSIYKIFTFDSDFWTLGFQVIPGHTRINK